MGFVLKEGEEMFDFNDGGDFKCTGGGDVISFRSVIKSLFFSMFDFKWCSWICGDSLCKLRRVGDWDVDLRCLGDEKDDDADNKLLCLEFFSMANFNL